MKICRVYNEEKSLTRFAVHKSGTVHGRCRDCDNEYYVSREHAIKDGTWVATHAKPNDAYMRTDPAIRTPTTWDLYWAAGFMEAEGSFCKSLSLHVSASQKEPELLYLLQEIFGGTVRFRGKDKHPTHGWEIYGPRAHGVMLTLYSMPSIKRQNQIRKALNKLLLPLFVSPITEPIISTIPEGFNLCKYCGEVKGVSDFTKSKRGTTTNKCRECASEYMVKRYEAIKAGTWNFGNTGRTGQKETTPKPITTPINNNIAWACVFLDREMTVRKRSSTYEIRVPQVNKQPLFDLQAMFGGGVSHSKYISHWSLYGEPAKELMLLLFPNLSTKRQLQLTQIL